MHSKRRVLGTEWLWIGFCALGFLPVVVLWPYRAAGFVSDDLFFGPGFSVTSWRDALGLWPHAVGSLNAWRPIVVLTYLLQGAWADGQPDAYRLFNYAVHGLNVMLLAVLVRQLTRRARAGFCAGALFAVHPIVNESVLWIAGRTFPICAAFALALCAWTVGGPTRRAWVQHTVGVALFVGALASYEFSVVLPLVLLMLVRLTQSRSSPDWRGIALFVLPYAITWLGYVSFRWLWLSDLSSDVAVAARLSQERIGGSVTYTLARSAIFFTLRLLAWPWFDRGSDITFGVTGLLTTVVAIGSAIVVLGRPQSRALGAFWLCWILLFFAPVAAHGFSDRFGYLSAAGLAGLIGTALAVQTTTAHLRSARAVAVTATALLLWMTWTADLREHGRDWDAAGRLAARIVDQVVEREPDPTQPVSLHFIDIPRRHRSALVFLTYFPLAVSSKYTDPQRALHTRQVHLHWEPEEAVLRSARATAPELAVRVYRWNAARESLELVWSRG